MRAAKADNDDEARDENGDRVKVEQPPILDEEDEAALDRIWDEIGREEDEERRNDRGSIRRRRGPRR